MPNGVRQNVFNTDVLEVRSPLIAAIKPEHEENDKPLVTFGRTICSCRMTFEDSVGVRIFTFFKRASGSDSVC